MIMKNKNFFGVHSSFYYFGFDHLYINMKEYIDDSISRNEYVSFIVNRKIYNDIMDITGISEKNSSQISNIYKIIEIYKLLGKTGIKDKLLKYENKIIKRGFTGLKFILDTSYFISNTSKDDFLKFDFDITNIILNTKTSVMCIYDFEDYINTKKIIDDEIINKSYENHFYRLYKNKIVNLRELIKI